MAQAAKKETLTVRILYAALSALFILLSLLPLRLLYVGADIMAGVLHTLVRYRRKAVKENLTSSFPEKTPREIAAVTRAYYRFLADYFVETLKLTTMSRRQMERRMRFEGIEQAEAALAAGHSVSLYLGHYCNWEWVSSIPLHIHAEGSVCAQIYHPLENPAADRLFLRLRGRWGAVSVKLHDTLRAIVRWKKEGRPSMTGYIADQVPGWNGIHCWVDFLHHDTPVYSGPEKISRMLHAECYYIDMSRPRRGYYTGRFVRMSADAAAEPEFAMTREYFRLLQESIERCPAYWLWSHRRWKRTRAKFEARFPDAADRLRHL